MAHDFKRFPELTNSQMQFYYFDSPHKQITEGFIADVVKVIDGDTIRVETSFRDFDFPIRFVNINAPELKKGGLESAKWLQSQLLNEEVYIKIDSTNRVGKWGRLLGDVILGGQSMSDLSLMMGYSEEFA
ncbi:MAG: hypothetical protein GWP19_00935 [Planctomycetia bacterium]|nr:hypothetical protein [Planctomycetia bacterium]